MEDIQGWWQPYHRNYNISSRLGVKATTLKAKDLAFKAKDLAFKAKVKDLAFKAKANDLASSFTTDWVGTR